jgi:hypothetical protein
VGYALTISNAEVHFRAGDQPTFNRDSQTSSASTAASEQAQTTSSDLFVMAGADIDRPGALPRANYNVGIGHTVGSLKKDPIGDELTFRYTYENAGTHGFLHTAYGEHSEQLGVMKNLSLPETRVVHRVYIGSNGHYQLHRLQPRVEPARHGPFYRRNCPS